MATDSFLKIQNLDGESKDASHENEIDVLAWSWGASQSGSFGQGGGGGTGKASFQDLAITKYVDKASTKLQEFCAMGNQFERAKLTVRKAGGKSGPLEFFVIDMKHVIVTSVSLGGSGGEERLTENVTLNFAEVTTKYTEQMEDGSGGENHEFNFSIQKNESI